MKRMNCLLVRIIMILAGLTFLYMGIKGEDVALKIAGGGLAAGGSIYLAERFKKENNN